MTLCVGLMSGTSLDGVDGVLAEFDPQTLQPRRLHAHVHLRMPAELRDELLALNMSGADELHRAALAGNALTQCYAQVVERLRAAAGVGPEPVLAIGAHGQTVRHRPGAFDGIGYSIQLINGALLAERTGIDTVCDFRSTDVAAGGQGAPLVPAFHAACFSRPDRDGAVLNIGGIANLTLLPAASAVGGLDTGPGNMLMDLWSQRHWRRPYDAEGAIAASGRILERLLEQLLDDDYFALPPPKSTGRDHFHAAWLDARLREAQCEDANPADIMATLAELTARTASDALRRQLPSAQWLRVCGGGAFNVHLMKRLHALLPEIDLQSTAAEGFPPDQVEASAFAWLAARRIAQRTGSLSEVTGARAPRILGAVYAAPPPER